MRRIIHLTALMISLTAPWALAQTAFEAVLGAQTQEYNDVVISQVTTVDTFVLENGQRVRLIGIKAPELPQRVRVEREVQGEMGFTMRRQEAEIDPTVTVEEEAFEFARELLEGQHVRLEFDVERKSEDHKTLAYVYLLKDDTFVNAELLKQGFAFLSIRPPNTKHEDALREAYREARQERRGLQGQ